MIQLDGMLNSGTGVIFGEFFAVRPCLTGIIENMLAPITSANKLRVRFVPGSAYKLDEKDFSFHNATEAEGVLKVATAYTAYTTGENGKKIIVDNVEQTFESNMFVATKAS